MATQNLLSKAKVITAKCPSGKRYKWFSDGNGLLLRVENTGKKVWVARLFSSDVNDGKETKRGIGSYPTIALKEARIIRDEYKKLWAKGIDPSIEKKKSKLAVNKSKQLTFEYAYQQALANRLATSSDGHKKRWSETYEKYLKNPLGNLPLTDINDEVVLTVLENIFKVAPSTSQKAKHQISVIFTYAKEKKWFKGSNPCNELTGNSLITPPKPKHFKYLEEHRVGEFLSALENDKKSGLTIRTFVYVVMVTALRSGSLANAKWSWLDEKTNTLVIPSIFMKGRQKFRCPIPKQAMVKLKGLKTFLGKNSKYIFEGLKDKPISNASARLCVQRLTGDKTTVHGFRTLFNIAVSKMGEFEIEKIESQLTHAWAKTTSRKTYMGVEDYLEDRRKIVQAYADWCDKQ